MWNIDIIRNLYRTVGANSLAVSDFAWCPVIDGVYYDKDHPLDKPKATAHRSLTFLPASWLPVHVVLSTYP